MKISVCCFRWLSGVLLFVPVAPAQVVISEFLADNKNTLVDEDGAHSDWIELYNTNASSVNLSGWSLTDDPARQDRWFFPATNLTTKGFLVVFASSKNRAVPGAPLHTDFGLSKGGEYLALLRPDGSVASEFTFSEQETDISYGMKQAVTTNVLAATGQTASVLIPPNGTLGSAWRQVGFDDSGWIGGPTGVGYETAVPGFAVYNYVASVGTCTLPAAQSVINNPSQQLAVYAENAPVINYFNTGGASHYSSERTFPGLTSGVEQNNFVVSATATITIPAAGSWTFGVNSDDGFILTIGSTSMSYPDPRGPGDTLQTFSFPAAGAYSLELVYYECTGGSEVELFAAQGSHTSWNATNFRLVGDTTNGGLAVTAPAVSGGGGLSYQSLINTDVQAQMAGVNASIFVRLPFFVGDPSAESLTLRMKYDDGYVAFLNGQEIARRNAPASPQWNSAAPAEHPNALALAFEDFNVSDHRASLQAGNNVLAIHGLNRSAADTDFLLVPELIEYTVVNTSNMFFSTPSPGALNIGGFVAFVADTKFSVDRGIYTAPFSLVITTATVGATIIYTTNGSVPSLGNGFSYGGPLAIGGTKVVRAAAFKTGLLPSGVDTQTYLFLNDVIRQSPNGETPPGWPGSWGANVVDYGMDPAVVNHPAYSGEISNSLAAIPSYSIVTALSNLFDPATGIYANPSQDGIDWERPASIELILPDGEEGFQINGGIRLRGGFSRNPNNPKHAFRLFFRSEYGAAKLDYPAFASQGGAESFDSFDLRTFQNYSWSFLGDYRFIGLRDQFSRDTQLAQGQPAKRGDFYHLYLNGQYWGLFNTDERSEASFGESYFGGQEEDYDVIKVETSAGYTLIATDGNMDAWTRLWQAATNGFTTDAAYFKVQGLNVDGTRNPAYENLLEVDNLIDYMLGIFFTGNIDAPISQFLGNNNPNNMYAMRNRTGLYGGFRFFAHDSEHTLLHESSLGNNDELHRDRTGPFPAGDPVQQGAASALARSNPQYLFSQLTANLEFRLRLADHIQKQFFNGGALTTEACRTRFQSRSNEIYSAVVAESARWGDSKRATPFTRNVEWMAEMNRVWDNYFAQRPDIVLGQFVAKGWFPTIAAPSFSQTGGNVTNGFQLRISAPAGVVYYTRDGSDPRLPGDSISPAAVAYSGPLTFNQSAQVKARVLNAGTWSALTEATFYVVQNFTELLITEIMYHPPGTTNLDGDEFEFIELKNVASSNLELSGVRFTDGITFTFPVGTFIAPGQFVVLVSHPAAFSNKYPGVNVSGVYTNRLSNGGETVALAHVTGTPIFTVDYGTRPPWPPAADGSGFSLVSSNPNLNPNPTDPGNWRASSAIGGSPGADDAVSNIPRVLINEALTHTDPPALDTIELWNPNPTNVYIGNWYLTDQRTVPQKFRIPANDPRAVISPGGYAVFTENDWNAGPTNGFRLDSHGEQIYLYSADTNGALTGFADGFPFGAAQNGVSFGRYVISTGEAQYPAQVTNTPAGSNAGPRIGPVVINEIQYHPLPGGDEFIELKNLTNVAVKLYDPLFPTNTWRLSGVGYDFPANTQIASNGWLLVVATDPTTFRTRYGVPASVPILGPYSGALQANGETLALQCPDRPDFDTNTGTIFIPYFDIDAVRYDDKAPWPTNADGSGASLERLVASAYGNDPINWRASPGEPSPGLDNTGARPPFVNAGLDRSFTVTNLPLAVAMTATATDDGLPNPPGVLTVDWSQVSGPGSVWFDDTQQPGTTVHFPGLGTYGLRLAANDGDNQVSDDVTITVERSLEASPFTFVSKGSVWKYRDDGSNQGTAWRALGFSDGSWNSGAAPLGYSDANGQWPATTNSYGPDANNKYVTTYYRRSFTLSDPSSVTSLVVSVQRDDGVVVYLNGTGIFTNNLPTGVSIGYRTNASAVVGGVDETTFYSQAVNPSQLVSGINVLAAEIHQVSSNSSDIIFDLELAGARFPANLGPAVNAGLDQTVTLPDSATLAGSVTDDALPLSPGLLLWTWSKFSGPGIVAFSNTNAINTTASFSTNGVYTLRLSASDGALTANDDLVVTVYPSVLPLRIESAVWIAGSPPSFRISFVALAGLSYTIQYRDSLMTGAWLKLADVPAQGTTQTVLISDAGSANSPRRYYRVVTPAQP